MSELGSDAYRQICGEVRAVKAEAAPECVRQQLVLLLADRSTSLAGLVREFGVLASPPPSKDIYVLCTANLQEL